MLAQLVSVAGAGGARGYCSDEQDSIARSWGSIAGAQGCGASGVFARGSVYGAVEYLACGMAQAGRLGGVSVEMELKQRSSSAVLDRVYTQWIRQSGHLPVFLNMASPRLLSYQRTWRLSEVNQEFEQWIGECGGVIRQEHRVRFIEFADRDSLLMFVLSCDCG